MLRLKLIACKVFYREISYLSAVSENRIDTTYLRLGLHDTPEKLNQVLQDEINRIEGGEDLYTNKHYSYNDFDAIVIGYGLCSKATDGLRSSKYPIIIPRAHDCISLFLGSKERYKEYFDSHSGGIYWYNPGWIENSQGMPGEETYKQKEIEYAEKYDEETAEYLIEAEREMIKNYKICTYVDWEQFENQDYIERTRKDAEFLGLKFDLLRGDDSLVKDLISGNWDDERFITVPPNTTVRHSFDERIFELDKDS